MSLTLDGTIRKEWHIERDGSHGWRIATKSINESIARSEVNRLNENGRREYRLVEVSIHTSRKVLQ